MSIIEAHPIGELSDEDEASFPDEPQAAPPESVEAESAQVEEESPVDAEALADAHDLPDALYDVPRPSTEAVPTSALPPKAPHSKVTQAEVQARRQGEAQGVQASFSRVPSSGRFRAKDGVARPRTFTARPPEGYSRHVNRADYTHTEARLVDIARETRSLVTRLERVYGRHVASAIAANSPPRGKPCNESPTHKNRRLFSEKIAAENLRIYNRLQAVKPSKDTAAAQLRRQWVTAQKYSRNCSNAQKYKRNNKGRSPARCADNRQEPWEPRSSRAQIAGPSYAPHVAMHHSEAPPTLNLTPPPTSFTVTVPSTVKESFVEDTENAAQLMPITARPSDLDD